MLPILPSEIVDRIVEEAELSDAYEIWRDCMRDSWFIINNAMSRKNGFWQMEEDNTEKAHWAFWGGGGEVQFQATNCSECGEYLMSNTFLHSPEGYSPVS